MSAISNCWISGFLALWWRKLWQPGAQPRRLGQGMRAIVSALANRTIASRLTFAAQISGFVVVLASSGATINVVAGELVEQPDNREAEDRAESQPKANRLELSKNSLRPTALEQQALVEIERLVGKRFRANENGAIVYADLGGLTLNKSVLVQLEKLENLQVLLLHRTELDNSGMARLSGLTNLRKLNLQSTNVGNDGLRHLAELTKLEFLDLGSTNVTSEGLNPLSRLTSLRVLRLSSIEIDDDGLDALTGLLNLELVDLSSTKVTDEGVARLQDSMPNTMIDGKAQWLSNRIDSENELSIEIAVPEIATKRTIDIRQEGTFFEVVITNKSQSNIRLWETWNSWGYFNLSFDIIDDNGAVVYTVVKKQKIWTRNGPTWLSLAPGENVTMKVDFDHDVWIRNDDLGDNKPLYLPFLALAHSTPRFELNMRAVFQVLPDWETIDRDIWTGAVRSPVGKFVIVHNPEALRR